MSIQVIAFEVDNTLWSGRLDARQWGKGVNAHSPVQDNIELIDDLKVRDKSNHFNFISLYPDVPEIIHDVAKRGMKLAIVSTNSSRDMTDRALFFFKARDTTGKPKPIIQMVIYNEVGTDRKVNAFTRIKDWSGASYREIIFFDCSSSSQEVQDRLGVRFAKVSRNKGLDWDTYQSALNRIGVSHTVHDNPYDTPFWGQPRVGEALGSGKFATVHESLDDSNTVIKVLKAWTREMRCRFLEIYNIIKDGHPLIPDANDDNEQYLYMLALELRNLKIVQQLKAPTPEHFTGWFTMARVPGIPLWKTPLYRKHPFSVPFQTFIRTGIHLAVDEIENYVRNYGIEHRDAHLANVFVHMQGDQPSKARLLDWGIAVLMKWDGNRYIRGQDHLVWQDSGAGEKYTPEEFRRYWITWMVTTEYEANMGRNAITDKDGREFLRDIEWWFRR